MGKTASVPCKQCGALNDVSLSEGTFEDNLRQAAFSFACRVCGAVLPDELPTSGSASGSPEDERKK
jgi:ribosomal protein S27E